MSTLYEITAEWFDPEARDWDSRSVVVEAAEPRYDGIETSLDVIPTPLYLWATTTWAPAIKPADLNLSRVRFAQYAPARIDHHGIARGACSFELHDTANPVSFVGSTPW